MKRLKVVHREGSRGDLSDIYQFLVEIGTARRTAQAYVRRLRLACERIGDAPRGGRSRDDLEPGLRTWSFERRAVIAYKVLGEEVAITNIFYAGRDIAAFYRLDPAPKASKA